jgi:hypothetical protein
MILCSNPECDRAAKVKGMCQKHYLYEIRKSLRGGSWTKRREDRFWKKVDKSGECWIWTGCVDVTGYGVVGVNAYPMKSHRFSWVITNGPVPDGLFVLHKCDNRVCVNPDHLFLGTHQDNMADRDKKGRQIHGERHASSKLTELQVADIRRRYVKGCRVNGIRPIARELGMSRSSVRSAIMGSSWKCVK